MAAVMILNIARCSMVLLPAFNYYHDYDSDSNIVEATAVAVVGAMAAAFQHSPLCPTLSIQALVGSSLS